MHLSGFTRTQPVRSSFSIASTGHAAAHTGSSQCQQYTASRWIPSSLAIIRMWLFIGVSEPKF